MSYLESAQKASSFDAFIDIKILVFSVSVTFEQSRSLFTARCRELPESKLKINKDAIVRASIKN